MQDLKQKFQASRYLFLISGLALALKLLYLFVIGPPIFGHTHLTTNDSFSYTDSFVNLLKTGTYTHIPGYEPASYGRLPGLPFIWGLFYLLFGYTKAFWAFAVFQIFIDCVAALWIYRMVKKLFSEKVALGTVVLYSFFPLTFYYITKTGTEYIGLFMCIAVLYQLFFFRIELKRVVLLSLCLVTAFFINEALLLLVPLSFFYLYRHFAFNLKLFMTGVLVFLIVYLPWPMRNFINHGVVMPVKELSAGYPSYNKDILSFMYWMYAWHDSDIMDYFNAAYNEKADIEFPEKIFASAAEKELAYKLIQLSRTCGSSFVEWQRIVLHTTHAVKCNQDKLIENGFEVLEQNYISAHPFRYYITVPLLNIKKALFKNTLTTQSKVSSYFPFMMMLRTCVILAGLFACFVYKRHDFFKLLLYFFLINLFFFSFVLRQVEMRYLYQADMLLLIAAGCLIFDKVFRKEPTSPKQ